MGGRGSKSGITNTAPATQNMQPLPSQQQGPIANQTPNDDNTPVTLNAVDQFSQMTDDELAQFYLQSQKTALPNHLGDVDDKTQKFIFAAGMNERPMVLDQQAFNQFMQDNNIQQSDILSRSINGGVLKTSAGNTRNLTSKDVADMLMYSKLNYIGGKIGGQAYGAGTYFDKTYGSATGYGSYTVNAVLNPATAKVITSSQLGTLAAQFDASHPTFAKATGGYSRSFRNNNMSIYATVLGYNVIKDSYSDYHNIIDRSALVYRK